MHTQRVNQPYWLSSSPIPLPLAGGVICVIAIYSYGVGLLIADVSAFRIWIREDGLAEWLTFAILIVASGYATLVWTTCRTTSDNRAASMTWFCITLIFLFGALEEVSYGQRIFGIETPDFLQEHGSQGKDSFYNRQSETNLHNLVISGININKLVFGKFLALFVLLYFIVAPILYRCNQTSRRFINHCGIPIIQNYQLAVYLAVVVLTATLHSREDRVNELLELVGCFIFLSVTVHPFNAVTLPTVKNFYKRALTSTTVG